MKPEFMPIPVPKNARFLDLLTAKLPYLKSAKVFIPNDLIAKLIRSCDEVRIDNGTHILVWRDQNLKYEQSISICLNSKSKQQTLSTINICNETFIVDIDEPKYELYFMSE